MADNGLSQNAVWPLPVFYFKVVIEDVATLSFKEVSGLDVENNPLVYRGGGSPNYSKISTPGINNYSKIILKKGSCKSDDIIWNWINEFKLNTNKRRKVTISLLDEEGTPTMVWKVYNAWASKIAGVDFDGKELAIEVLELSHEGITIENN